MISTTSSSAEPGRSYEPNTTSMSDASPPPAIRSSAIVCAHAVSPVGAIHTASGAYDGGSS